MQPLTPPNSPFHVTDAPLRWMGLMATWDPPIIGLDPAGGCSPPPLLSLGGPVAMPFRRYSISCSSGSARTNTVFTRLLCSDLMALMTFFVARWSHIALLKKKWISQSVDQQLLWQTNQIKLVGRCRRRRRFCWLMVIGRWFRTNYNNDVACIDIRFESSGNLSGDSWQKGRQSANRPQSRLDDIQQLIPCPTVHPFRHR